MKDKAFAFLKMVGAGVSILLAGVIIAVVFVSIFISLREIWFWAFYPENLPISAKITDFDRIEIETHPYCQDAIDLNKSEYFPLKVYINALPGGSEQIYQIQSETPFHFQLKFNQSDYQIESTMNGQAVDSIVDSTSKKFVNLSGTASSVNIDFSKIPLLFMSENLCSSNIFLSHYPSNFYLVEIGHQAKGISALKTSQFFGNGESVVITLAGPISLDNQSNIMLDKVEIVITGTTQESAELETSLWGENLNTELPRFLIDPSTKMGNGPIYPNGNVHIDSFFVDTVRVISPVGQVQFGSYSPIDLNSALTNLSYIELELPKSPLRIFENMGGYYSLEGDIEKNVLTVNGTTSRVIYRKQEYGISNWQKLPGYAQGGIFTLLLGALTGTIELVRAYIKKRRTNKMALRYEPQKGDFVCVMDSGYIICGTLMSKPGFWFPFFVLSNARRKYKNEETWEEKSIAQIHIKANRVEQTYFIE